MCSSYSLSRCAIAYFTVIVLSLNVINVDSKFIKTFDDENIVVSTSTNDFVENYDVTTIYKISNTTKATSIKDGGFESDNFGLAYNKWYSIEVKSGTNAIGLPINISYPINNNNAGVNSQTLFRNDSVVRYSYRADAWTRSRATIYGDCCYQSETGQMINRSGKELESFECLDVIEYSDSTLVYKEFINVLNITWNPQKQLNSLAIEYVFRENIYFDMRLIIFDFKDRELYSSNMSSDQNLTTLIIKNKKFDQKKYYKIAFYQFENNIDDELSKIIRFGIFQITSLLIPEKEEEMKTLMTTFKNNLKTRPTPLHVIGSLSNVRNKPSKANRCLNGGFGIEIQEMCICPPGFTGKFCETGCGPNYFGADCSSRCSASKKGCRGMYLCTSSYGCTCPPGLTGNLCDQSCPPNTYGANCTQTCLVRCQNKCNQYTGQCGSWTPLRMKMHHTHLPSNNDCDTDNMYLLEAPKQVSVGPNNITIEINFEPSNMNCKDKYSNLKHYQIIYKTSEDKKFTHSKSKLFSQQNKVNHTINGLKLDTMYKIGVLLIRDDGKYNDEDIAYGFYNTSCTLPDGMNYNVKIAEENDKTIVSWDPILPSPTQCSVTGYIITLTNDVFFETLSVDKSAKSYAVEDLLSGYTYDIQLTPWVKDIALPSSPVYKHTPSYTSDFKVEDIRAKVRNETIDVFWTYKHKDSIVALKYVPSIKYIVKYKINQIFSCSLEEREHYWIDANVVNSTNHTISHIIPNARYVIQVIIAGEEQNTPQNENIVYALTPAAIPSIAPVIDTTRPVQVTNDTVSFAWKIDPANCSELNGEITTYLVELLKIDENSTIPRKMETSDTSITIDNLKPDTPYNLKAYVKNDVGYNASCFLTHTFKTRKFGSSVVPISDVSIYKNSKVNHTIGLRWKQLDSSVIDEVEILYQYNGSNELVLKNFTIKPQICPAWSKYFCRTLENVNLRYNSTFQMKAISPDFSDVPPLSFRYTDINNTSPDSPRNFNISINKTTVVLTWDIPWTFNGDPNMFLVSYEEISSNKPDSCCAPIQVFEVQIDTDQPTYNKTLLDLKPGSTYMFGVITQNFGWSSSPARVLVTLPYNDNY